MQPTLQQLLRKARQNENYQEIKRLKSLLNHVNGCKSKNNSIVLKTD